MCGAQRKVQCSSGVPLCGIQQCAVQQYSSTAGAAVACHFVGYKHCVMMATVQSWGRAQHLWRCAAAHARTFGGPCASRQGMLAVDGWRRRTAPHTPGIATAWLCGCAAARAACSCTTARSVRPQLHRYHCRSWSYCAWRRQAPPEPLHSLTAADRPCEEPSRHEVLHTRA